MEEIFVNKYLKLLDKGSLFAGITESEISALLSCLSAKEQRYQKDEFIYRAGDVISTVAIVLEGIVYIINEDFWGNRSILTEIEEGHMFGETYACIGKPLEVYAVAGRDTVILTADIGKILNFCSNACTYHNRLVRNFINILANRNRELTLKLEHMSQRTTREKLLSYLSEQSRRAGSPSFEIPFNRQQLADYLAVDRSAMSAELSRMRDEGIIEFERNKFRLLLPREE
ncbi:MAG TPA: Crp/Fnr family transcriptional regulator [Clostridiales bacterium]|nr:Crp/Fnr family transcriptional regulator [Clostridiales bacterium]